MKPQDIIISKPNSSAVIAAVKHPVLYGRVLQRGSLFNTSVHYPLGINAVLLNQAQR